jgi:hypothetical protein
MASACIDGTISTDDVEEAAMRKRLWDHPVRRFGEA